MTSSALRVTVRKQVIDFIRQQPPEARHRLRLAIRGLAKERGDRTSLEGDLEGLHRLRVGPYRIIFWYVSSRSGTEIDCVFAERRSLVYLLLQEILRRGMLSPEKEA